MSWAPSFWQIGILNFLIIDYEEFAVKQHAFLENMGTNVFMHLESLLFPPLNTVSVDSVKYYDVLFILYFC